MSTPFSNIFDRFLTKITDHSYSNLTELELEDILVKFLKTSSIKFGKCKKDLSDRDDDLKQFNENLSEIEEEIISIGMVVEYLNGHLVNLELLKQAMGSKDFKMYSQAEHLKELRNLRLQFKSEFDDLIIQYTYDFGDLTELK